MAERKPESGRDAGDVRVRLKSSSSSIAAMKMGVPNAVAVRMVHAFERGAPLPFSSIMARPRALLGSQASPSRGDRDTADPGPAWLFNAVSAALGGSLRVTVKCKVANGGFPFRRRRGKQVHVEFQLRGVSA